MINKGLLKTSALICSFIILYCLTKIFLIDEKVFLKKESKILFLEKEHDFGNINAGDTVSYNFKFKNVGNKDLKIYDASSSCGCTIPNWDKKPIKPDMYGLIKINFTKKNELGEHKRLIVIKANTIPEYSTIKIKANVVE